MALPPLRPVREHTDQTFRVPYVPIAIDKGPMTEVVKFAAVTEAYVLGAIFGENKVSVLPLNPMVHGQQFHEASFEEEHARLEAKFGVNGETGVLYVEEAYGRKQQSMLAQLMAERHSTVPTEKPIVEQQQHIAAPQNNRAKGSVDDEVPEVNIAEALDQEAKETEAKARSLTTKKDCIEYLTSLGVSFSASAKLSTLRVLAANCQDIEELGYEVPRGADAETIDRILDQVQDASEGAIDETGAAQTLLEQAAGQSVPD